MCAPGAGAAVLWEYLPQKQYGTGYKAVKMKKERSGKIFMKLMFGSDIHGAEKCCLEMLSAFEREGADKLILLGDILYHGP
ncbi:MAG: hypothetical protein K2N72_10410, partial [Oscillospiraceae bacterium]|nr:hypothetical protein [Oscillospiraceae bacterium]